MRPLVLLALLLAACRAPTAGFLGFDGTGTPGDGEAPPNWSPPGAERFVPPNYYAQWWVELEDCVQLYGDVMRIRWYRLNVGGLGFPCPFAASGICTGLWEPPHDVLLAQTAWWSEPIVKHEMLHDLSGRSDHEHFGFAHCMVTPR
jgi:hypothetical protein